MEEQQTTIYEHLGGDELFKKLVDAFYARVEKDPLLRPIFPEDLEPGKKWQFLFITQYFGGPSRYIIERGHPRLRMRHMTFLIDEKIRDAWVNHMLAALEEVGIPEPFKSEMRQYFEETGTSMINLDYHQFHQK
ncbi:MAG: globin [Chloroflexi bacterium]|nr:globin [Chloroflexota bacterium]